MELAMKIWKTLREYKETILLDSALLYMPETVETDARSIPESLPWNRKRLLGKRGLLNPPRKQRNTLQRPRRSRRPRPPPTEDRISSFLRDHCPLLFLDRTRTAKNNSYNGSALAYLSSNRIAVVAAIPNILLAAAMLFGSIFNLYYVEGPKKRLAIVAAYTVGFHYVWGF
jgi:hypothetical protein